MLIPRKNVTKTYLVNNMKEVTVDLNHQATRWPVFKDVGSLWRFDYKTAEKRVFKGKHLWDPSRLPVGIVDQYL